ncbi:MAG TPA: hypothetical protein VJC17_01400 [Candidatus Dojkabacteria bacterium]|nr:hypothetical protein [Candidatus Dojkabacteria bacterium]
MTLETGQVINIDTSRLGPAVYRAMGRKYAETRALSAAAQVVDPRAPGLEAATRSGFAAPGATRVGEKWHPLLLTEYYTDAKKGNGTTIVDAYVLEVFEDGHETAEEALTAATAGGYRTTRETRSSMTLLDGGTAGLIQIREELAEATGISGGIPAIFESLPIRIYPFGDVVVQGKQTETVTQALLGHLALDWLGVDTGKLQAAAEPVADT